VIIYFHYTRKNRVLRLKSVVQQQLLIVYSLRVERAPYADGFSDRRLVIRKGSVFLGLAPLVCYLSAFSQSGAVSLPEINVPEVNLPAPGAAEPAHSTESPSTLEGAPGSNIPSGNSPSPGAKLEKASEKGPAVVRLPLPRPYDRNREVYYRNKLEFSLDAGWLPINIPFPLDVFVGDAYNTYPLKYTLVPIIASLRWQVNNIGGPSVLRGNWDLTLSGSVTAIPRGPETRYFSYIMGIRRNFIPRNRRLAPYFDVRLGVGNIDAKGPQGVKYAQGEDLTFTVNMGSGVRYNFTPRFALSAGLNFMHISNLDLSQGNGKPNWGIRNYGINVYGPMVGIDIQLGKRAGRTAN
jgi:hypothetical protein